MAKVLISVAIVAAIYAKIEIQIEGKHGGAAKLPCWRKTEGWIVKRVFGGAPVTGYHTWMNILILTVSHLAVFIFFPWSFTAELLIAGLILQFMPLEDFFWFMLNPDYGIRRFKKSEISWHKRWIGPVPSFYIYFSVSSIILIYLGSPWMLKLEEALSIVAKLL